LGLVLATPRMHGIHHSARREEQDSNWSSGLSIWDRLHGTLRQDVPQERLVIGLAPSEMAGGPGLVQTLTLPFTRLAGARA
jgi:sterol desaturase/sphingolipid hydroxylase (fatty acid hydroxylase superfamily)